MTTTPVFIGTWKFGLDACRAGWSKLAEGATALDAIEIGANSTEDDPDVQSVGYGGFPNANGVVELDAAIMEGKSHAAGSVAGLVGIGRAISVARRIMECTPHVMLVGEHARQFAIEQGFPAQNQLTETSRLHWEEWRRSQSVSEVAHFEKTAQRSPLTPDDHDTIGVCALDCYGNLAVGCTTSGMAWKLPGRVGDSPIIGSGLYVDNEIGAAAATGHGDEMMKACLTYRVIMLMGEGRSAQEACVEALRYLMRKRRPEDHHDYGAGLIALRKDGQTGAAATVSGFRHPDRLWQWAVATSSEPILKEGVYVSNNDLRPTLT